MLTGASLVLPTRLNFLHAVSDSLRRNALASLLLLSARTAMSSSLSRVSDTCHLSKNGNQPLFIAHFSAEDFGLAHIPTVKFPTACAWVSSAIMGGEEVFIGLSERNKLYVNAVTASSECNSFALHSNYVLFTTLSHVLRFMNLQRTVQGKSFDTTRNDYVT
jgi:hypothetical protein